MLELISSALNEKGSGLIILLTVIVLAITGSYKLLTDDLQEMHDSIKEVQKALHRDAEALHQLDKRITILQVKNDRE